ncbi:carbon-nitrogen hydrolase [Balneolaceae bacterium ANBcel3]|nr:carbon-nitrogen hydrolase [Balneolaceae bacterium ANBcel3]
MNPERPVTISLIQTHCTSDIEDNLSRTEQFIRQAAENGAQIILLQELFAWPYFCQEVHERFFDWAEPVPGPIIHRFESLARELEVVIVLPLFEKRTDGLYHNTAAVIDADGKYLGKYRKMHIPEDPGFHEKFYFTPGDLGYSVFKTRYATLGVLICWDQWYPEAARLTAMAGADLLIYPTAIASLPQEEGSVATSYIDAWQTIQRSHAIANGCFVASINRTGQENNLSFWGRSFVCNPMGTILAEASGDDEVLTTQIHRSEISTTRNSWPFFRDRRIDSYNAIVSRWIDDGE